MAATAIPLYIKQVERTPDGVQRVTEYDLDVDGVVDPDTISKYTMPNHYRYFLLDEESSEWVLRIYPIPNAERLGFAETDARLRWIFADMKAFGTSIAYVTKDQSFTAISFRENGKPRAWDPHKLGLAPKLRTMRIEMSPKSPKRLAMLGTQTYLNGRFDVRFVTEDTPRRDGALTIHVTPHIEGECHEDGEYYIHPQLRDDLVRRVYYRVAKDDKAKAKQLRRKLHGAAYNARVVTEIGVLKGDVVVSWDIKADIHVCECNIKPEIMGEAGVARIQMFPQEQKDQVVTNRQTISSFYEWLFAVPTPGVGDSEGLVKDALVDQFDRYIKEFRSGKLMSHMNPTLREEDDSIKSMHQKMVRWVRSGRNMKESLWLTMMLAGQIVDMNNPLHDEDRKRRFPVPYAYRVSLRNVTSYRMAFGGEPMLTDNEAFIDESIGLIVPDATFVDVAEVLGGADKDDHVEVHYRIAEDDDEFFGITAGDIVMVLIRNPVGISSDGKRVASEYYILRVAGFQADAGTHELPTIRMADRPLCTAELKLPEPTFVETEPDLPKHYSKEYFIDQVYVATSIQGVYGTHANQMMVCALYGIPFKFVAPEETFVDVCQQTRAEVDLEFIKQYNADNLDHIVDARVPLDPFVIWRLGLEGSEEVIEEPGIVSELVAYHRAQVQRFIAAANLHIRSVLTELKTRYQDHEVTCRVANVPYLIAGIQSKETEYREANNLVDEYLSHTDWEKIGDIVADRLNELEAAGQFTREVANQRIREAYGWIWNHRVVESRFPGATVKNMFTGHDAEFMRGRMFYRLIEALNE